MRICCLNNYSLAKSLHLAQAGLGLGQHSWGLESLQGAGHEVLIAPYHAPKDGNLLERVSRSSRHAAGQLDQQMWAWRHSPDLFYSADQLSLAGLALARRVLARRARMISVVHHPMLGRGANVRAAAIRAHDTVLTLNQTVCHQLAQQGIDARFVPWGPDLKSHLYDHSDDGGFAISTGKSNRDVATLVKALSRSGQPGVVYDLGRSISQAPENIAVVHPGGVGRDPDSGNQYLTQPVLEQTRAAGFVAIPIANPERLTGLTEINDALALGKPIIITRSRYTPVDVEAIGCGIVVEPGDVDGWLAAIESMRDPITRREMGARGRSFAENAWNYEMFGQELVKVVEEVAGR